MRKPQIELLRLRERVAGNGSTYFIGWLGSAKVVVLKDEYSEPDQWSIANWRVLLEPNEKTGRSSQESNSAKLTEVGAAPAPKRTQRRKSRASSSDARAQKWLEEKGITNPEPNDELPF